MAAEREQTQAQQPVFTIEKIYVKDLSLEVPNSPQAFPERGEARRALSAFEMAVFTAAGARDRSIAGSSLRGKSRYVRQAYHAPSRAAAATTADPTHAM